MNRLQAFKSHLHNGVKAVEALFEKVPKKPLQRGLLIATAGCAILSAIPPCRLAGNLAVRSIALLSSGVNGVEGWKREGKIGHIVQFSKIAIVALGLVGAIAASPFLLKASLVCDTALQVFELGRALHKGEGKRALYHLVAIVINSAILVALSVGSWQLMVTAAAVSALVMFALACRGNNIDFLGYIALAGVGMAQAMTLSPLNLNPNRTAPFPKLPIGGAAIVTRDLR